MVSNDINYSELNCIQPLPIRDFQKNLDLIRWFLQHGVVAGGWIKSDFLRRSDTELLTPEQQS